MLVIIYQFPTAQHKFAVLFPFDRDSKYCIHDEDGNYCIYMMRALLLLFHCHSQVYEMQPYNQDSPQSGEVRVYVYVLCTTLEAILYWREHPRPDVPCTIKPRLSSTWIAITETRWKPHPESMACKKLITFEIILGICYASDGKWNLMKLGRKIGAFIEWNPKHFCV